MFYTLDKFAYKSNNNVYIVCAGITQHALVRLGSNRVYCHYKMKSLSELVDPTEYNKIELEINSTFSQPFMDKFNYMNNVPIYVEHKLPDAMSSFAEISIKVINNCEWNDTSRIVDGSDETTMCAHPFYKTVNFEKGASDRENENEFINKCVAQYNI